MSDFTLYYRSGDTWEIMPKSWELWAGARRIVEREYLRGEFQWGQKRYWAAFGSADGPPPGVNAGTVPTFAAAASDIIPEDPRIAAYIERTGCTRAEFDELLAAGVITPRVLAGVDPLSPEGDPCSFTTAPGPLVVKIEPTPTRRSRRSKAAKALREEAVSA